jgi:putative oxidoreductase
MESLVDRLQVLAARVLDFLERLRWLAPLLARLAVGLLFTSTGWGKVHSISKVTEYFESLHIPAPGFNAVLVGYSELIGGALLVLGLITRLAAIPLIASMVIAILTARLGDLHNVFDLVGFDEFTYLVVLVMIVLIGPGSAALDAVVFARLRKEPPR